MKWFLCCFTCSIILSFIFTVIIINWIDDNDTRVSVEFVDGQVYLNIYADVIVTCNDIKTQMDIKPIIVKDKMYSPTCIRINDELIRIVYTPDTNA